MTKTRRTSQALYVAGLVLVSLPVVVLFILTRGCVISCLEVAHDPDVLLGEADDFDRESQPWVECSIPLPDDHGRLVFLRRNAHPRYAEYDRKLRFEHTGSAGAVRWLPINVGGGTMINLYWYPASEEEGPCVRFQDQWDVYVADLRHETVSLIGEVSGVRFIGEIPPGSRGRTGYGWTKADDEEEPRYLVCGKEAHEITGLLAHSEGEYIGRLEGRSGAPAFVSRDKAPEEEITMVRRRR